MTVASVFLKLTNRNKTLDMTISSIRPYRVEVVTAIEKSWAGQPFQRLWRRIGWRLDDTSCWEAIRLQRQAFQNDWGLPYNGSCYTAAAETRSFAKELGLKPVTTPVTSPQSNGMAESFVKMLKRDYAKLANRRDSKTVMAQFKDWFNDYNSYHPHSALNYLPPTLFREKRLVT